MRIPSRAFVAVPQGLGCRVQEFRVADFGGTKGKRLGGPSYFKIRAFKWVVSTYVPLCMATEES